MVTVVGDWMDEAQDRSSWCSMRKVCNQTDYFILLSKLSKDFLLL